MRPIFHLSIPVRDLQEAVDFYAHELGADIGRRTEAFADALVFGAQITLQNDPSSVTAHMPRTRPVSYTHLDVYKRQSRASTSCPSPWPCSSSLR